MGVRGSVPFAVVSRLDRWPVLGEFASAAGGLVFGLQVVSQVVIALEGP